MVIGRFLVLPRASPGKIWISIFGDGEGGEFDEAELAEAIREFYAKRF
jgi:hypothetical protein